MSFPDKFRYPLGFYLRYACDGCDFQTTEIDNIEYHSKIENHKYSDLHDEDSLYDSEFNKRTIIVPKFPDLERIELRILDNDEYIEISQKVDSQDYVGNVHLLREDAHSLYFALKDYFESETDQSSNKHTLPETPTIEEDEEGNKNIFLGKNLSSSSSDPDMSQLAPTSENISIGRFGH